MRYIVNHLHLNFLFIGFIVITPFLLFWRWVIKGEVLFWGTLLLQFWPWRHLVKTYLLNGNWPLWNPLLGNGTPLLANLQSAVFYPPNLIYLVLPVAHALTFSILLHLLLAGLFMYFYARHIGLVPFAATVSALAYMFSGYLVGRTQFVTMINAAAWFPLVLLLSDKVATQQTGLSILWLALILAVQLLAGHAQLWFYGLWLLGAYMLFRSWQLVNNKWANVRGHKGQRTKDEQQNNKTRFTLHALRFTGVAWKLGLAIALSLLLAAVQILPAAEFVSQSQRGGGAERTFALTYSFWPWRLITLLVPDFFGNPAQGNYWGYANYWEDHAYVGILPFILALTAIWLYGKFVWQRRNFDFSGNSHRLQIVPFFAGLIPVSLLLALGWNTPIYLWVFDHIPGFNLFQAPARLLIWYTVAMAVLAGIGAQFFESTLNNRPNWRRLLAACVAFTATGFIGEYFLTGREITFLTAIRTTGILLIISITLLLIRPPKEKPGFLKETGWQWLVIIFVAFDLLRAAFPLTPTLPATIFTRPIASAEFLKDQPGDYRFFVDHRLTYNTIFDRYFRFEALGPPQQAYWQELKETLVPNFGVYAHLPASNNDDPLVVGRWQQLTNQLTRANAAQHAQLLAIMNAAYFVTASTEATGATIYNSDAFRVKRVPHSLPRAYFVGQAYKARNTVEAMNRLTAANFDSRQEVVIMNNKSNSLPLSNSLSRFEAGLVTVQQQGPNQVQLTVTAPGAGFVVLTDTFYPGWQATLDGEAVEIWQANLAFRAIAVEAGQHEIRFRYRPYSFTMGLWTSIITCLVIAVVIIIRLTRR